MKSCDRHDCQECSATSISTTTTWILRSERRGFRTWSCSSALQSFRVGFQFQAAYSHGCQPRSQAKSSCPGKSSYPLRPRNVVARVNRHPRPSLHYEINSLWPGKTRCCFAAIITKRRPTGSFVLRHVNPHTEVPQLSTSLSPQTWGRVFRSLPIVSTDGRSTAGSCNDSNS